ncbi:32739_t:CDS:1, partial [Gigaspora margarita]
KEYLFKDNKIGDIFDGNQYKSLATSGLFSDSYDIAFTISIDGYQLFKQK